VKVFMGARKFMRLVVENLGKEYRGNGQAVQALTRVQLALGPGVLLRFHD